jgi:hypothetical protein
LRPEPAVIGREEARVDSMILRVPFNGGAVLARQGGLRLLLIDPVATWIWEGFEASLDAVAQAEAMTARFDLPLQAALEDVRRVRERICIELGPEAVAGQPEEAWERCAEREPVCSRFAASWLLRAGDRSVSLKVADGQLAAATARLVAHLGIAACAACMQRVHLIGTPASWSVYLDGYLKFQGAGAENAVVQVMDVLVGLAECVPERLLSLHGAGIVLPDGLGAVLVGAGGTGKTTLAAALNADGHALLSDDVIPVTPNGELIGMGFSLCLKPGSWPILDFRFPDLKEALVFDRLGQQVRYVRPRGSPAHGPVPVGLFLFPEYRPGSRPSTQALSPERVLQRIVESNSVICGLTQEKLESLVRWVASAPAFALVYPDLESGLSLVRERVAEVAGSGRYAVGLACT